MAVAVRPIPTAGPHRPTVEQTAVMDLFKSGRDMVIQAGAGTGKTTTLGMLARTTSRHGCYVAFNKSAAQDADRAMPVTVQSSTMHSLAYRALNAELGIWQRLNDAKRMPSARLAKRLGIGPVHVTIPGAPVKVLAPALLAGHVMRALRRFCESAAESPGPEHFPYLHGIDVHDADGVHGNVNNRQLAYHLLEPLTKAWDDVRGPAMLVPFAHEHYLKIWQLRNPQLPGEFVLFDEAQDANGVMLAVLAAQTGKQMVYVGDSQQQIYEWRGAINALDQFEGEQRWLSQSFRFGPAAAELANVILARLDSPLRLRGTPSLATRVGRCDRPRAVLCRSNATAVNVLLGVQREGRTGHLVGGDRELIRFATAAAKLQAGEKVTHPDLACFDSWREVQAYVDQDPAGDDLRMMVKLLDDYGVQIVLDALDGAIGEDGADVIISTAHRAKGREWPSVSLATDFDPPRDGDGNRLWELQAPEWRLLYVACTRAREVLDITRCEAVSDLAAGR
jgi:hypothetical protein